MNKIKPLILLICVCFFLTACDKSLDRAERTIGLVQDDVTTILNALNEIQNQEKTLQSDFEQDLAQNNLELFNSSDSKVETNIKARQAQIDEINKKRQHLTEMQKELGQLKDKNELPTALLQQIYDRLATFEQDIATYTTEYSSNLALESNSFKSIANPESNYTSFFNVLKNINTLSVNNYINLDKVLPHFEQLNATLVNVKVDLVNQQAKQK